LLQCIKKFALTFDAKSITFHADGITFGGFVSARSLGVDYPAWGTGALAAAGWRPRHVGG
jgi:hypothetical protein